MNKATERIFPYDDYVEKAIREMYGFSDLEKKIKEHIIEVAECLPKNVKGYYKKRLSVELKLIVKVKI